ncbi:MAG: MFS transporter [Clostridia bacterium]|nr:MFS transporter [Clostridia bacterium]
MKLSAKHTLKACYVGYLTQALTINFAPLLFLTFEKEYDISLGKISLLIGISFLTQLLCDACAARFPNFFKPRLSAIIAHVLAVIGLTGYAYLPKILPSAYLGLVICVIVTAVGGGIIEVLISPIAEACPTTRKSANMSLLHSFYSWGQAGVVLLSTLFFTVFDISNWQILACLWAIIPAIGAISFIFVPIYNIPTELGKEKSKSKSKGLFALLFLMMFCAGAAEMAMSQWASTFAESGLGVPKAVGDILGPCLFGIFMGSARVFYAKCSEKIRLERFMLISAILCLGSYLLSALAAPPIISLLGCALCGLSVGIMWPGTYSLAAKKMPFGGVRMFALLALGGDVGCLAGPTAAGWIADAAGGNLKLSFLISAIFPLAIILIVIAIFGVKSFKKSV